MTSAVRHPGFWYTFDMDSPFPGMDPYLERFWNDVHGKLIAYIADDLNERLPPQYRATMQVRVVFADVNPPAVDVRFPGVAVVSTPPVSETDRGGGTATVVRPETGVADAPFLVRFRIERRKEYSVEIRDTASGEQVVTAIEVISPDNKRSGDGMRQFRTKQVEYHEAGVNRVEVDLLRRGTRLFDFEEARLPPERRTPYYVCVYPGQPPWHCLVYAIGLRAPLPAIGIPLREGDADVTLDLQSLIRRVYRNGRFPIDYGQPCDPPLDGPDDDWAAQLLQPVAAAAPRTQQPAS